MINPQWLKLPISQTNLQGPKDVWAIEVLLYLWWSAQYLLVLGMELLCEI